jgi:hypothetical protein
MEAAELNVFMRFTGNWTLTLPYFPNRALRSVALVDEDKPLTHKLRLFAVAGKTKQIHTVI